MDGWMTPTSLWPPCPARRAVVHELLPVGRTVADWLHMLGVLAPSLPPVSLSWIHPATGVPCIFWVSRVCSPPLRLGPTEEGNRSASPGRAQPSLCLLRPGSVLVGGGQRLLCDIPKPPFSPVPPPSCVWVAWADCPGQLPPYRGRDGLPTERDRRALLCSPKPHLRIFHACHQASV